MKVLFILALIGATLVSVLKAEPILKDNEFVEYLSNIIEDTQANKSAIEAPDKQQLLSLLRNRRQDVTTDDSYCAGFMFSRNVDWYFASKVYAYRGFKSKHWSQCIYNLATAVTSASRTCCPNACYNNRNIIGATCKAKIDVRGSTWNDARDGLYLFWLGRITVVY